MLITPDSRSIMDVLYSCDFNHFEQYGEIFIGGRYKKTREGVLLLGVGGVLSKMVSEGDLEVIASEGKQRVYIVKSSVDADSNFFSGGELDVMHALIFLISTFDHPEEFTAYIKEDYPFKIASFMGMLDYDSVFYRELPHIVGIYDDMEDEETEPDA